MRTSINNMQANSYILWLGSLLLLVGCGQPDLIPSDYVAWVQDEAHGLRQTRGIAPLQVTALYKPVPYLIAQEERTNAIDPQLYQTRTQALEGMQYYTLQVALEGSTKQDITNYQVADGQAQQERLAYLSFGMQQDIQLIQGTDTLPCRLFHFERSYDLAPHRTFVLAFDQPAEASPTQERTLVVELRPFNTGPLKFNYSTATLSNIPNLAL